MYLFSKHSLFLAVIINVFFIFITHFFGVIMFGISDDYAMSRILEGVYGDDYNVHMTFINVVYGYVLLPLYYLFPKIGWYYIGETFAVFASFTTISYVIIRLLGVRLGLILAMLFLTFFAPDFYLALQFTQCASALTAAGIILFAFEMLPVGPDERRNGIIVLILSLFLMLWGSVMRYDAFLMGMPFLAVLLAVNCKFMCRKKIFIVFLSLLVTCTFGLKKIDQLAYGSPEYQAYIDFQKARVRLNDFHATDDEKIYEDLEELGNWGDDFKMIRNWKFYDNEVFSMRNLSVFDSVLKTHIVKKDPVELFYSTINILPRCAKEPIVWFWMLISFLLILTNNKKSYVVWCLLALILCYIGYFLSIARLIYRVESGLWLYAIVALIPCFPSVEDINKKFNLYFSRTISSAVIALVAILNVFIYATDRESVHAFYYSKRITKMDYAGFFKYVDSLPDSTLLMVSPDIGMRLSINKTPPYLSEMFGSQNRFVPEGGWTMYFPSMEREFRKRGMENPLRDVINDNVLVVGESELSNFLTNHYYDSVIVDIVRDFNGIGVYKYSLVKDSL
ncbi:hypothetical protein [Fibrobacter sp. UWB5]|uniref:hypothetical protein n=1 Tax=Fibrobacter sp. UWB5 TaxID=1964360 RepID=UPI000B51FA2D|nr:hypothetical protein [Fibrobacter sp. UWB5]OWV14356.1 hypothetical protein B7989_02555 [Fibrobacter sp. UWB5]